MRILFVLPDLPHPPFTGAHSRPLTLLRAAARSHEVAVVGAAPADADLGVLRALCAEVRVAPAGAARPASRRTLAAGRRLVTPVPLVSAGRSRAISDLVDDLVSSWQAGRHARRDPLRGPLPPPGRPAHRRPPRRAQRPLRVRRHGAALPLPRRQPAGGHQPPVRAAPPGRRHPGQHQRRRPRAPGHARRRVVHHPPGVRPAAGGGRVRAQLRRCGTTWPCGCSSSAPSSIRPTATPPSGWSIGSRPSCAPSACPSPWSSPGCRRRPGCARPAAPASPSSPTPRTWTRSTAAPTSCSRRCRTAAAPRTRRSRPWPGACR